MHYKQINLTIVDEKTFKNRYVGCVILTKDNQILLQQRGEDWSHYPGYIAEFGGRIEADETPMVALIRELNEELGAHVFEKDVVSFGAITETLFNDVELVYCYFWHDLHGTISGCYEGDPIYFADIQSALDNQKMTDGLRWLLVECKKLKLLK